MSTRYYRVQGGDIELDSLMDTDRVSSAWHRDDLDRPGVSVCASTEELAVYLAGPGAGIPFGQDGWVLVELEGEEIEDADALDADDGEVLIRPTRVVSCQPIPDEFFEMIGAAYDEMGA